MLNSFRYAGWWRSLYELYRVVEFGTGSIADHALALIKLVTVPAKSLLANPTNASAVPAALAGTLARTYYRVTGANTGLEVAPLADGVKTAATLVSAAITVLATTATYSIPGGTLAAGSRFVCEYAFDFVRGATATALNLIGFFTVGGANVSVAPPSQVAAGTYSVRVLAEFTVLTTGAGGTAMATIHMMGDAITSTNGFARATNLALAIDTTVANNISGAAQMNAAVAATSIQATGGHLMQLN